MENAILYSIGILTYLAGCILAGKRTHKFLEDKKTRPYIVILYIISIIGSWLSFIMQTMVEIKLPGEIRYKSIPQLFKFNNKMKPQGILKSTCIFMMVVCGILFLTTDDEAFAWLMSMFVLVMFIGFQKKDRKPPKAWWEDVHTGD